MKSKQKSLLLFTLVALCIKLDAQGIEQIIDFLTVYPNKKAASRDSTVYPAKAIFTPVVAYAPETSLSFGLGVKGLFKIKGSGAETRTSNIPLTLQYTINNNYLFFSGFQIFFPQERYILTGNLRVRSFPSFYFGVGKNTPNTNKEKYSYNQVLFEPIFLKNCFIPYLYMGTGFRYHKISNLKTVSEGLLERSKQVGALGSTSVGLELAILYDSRDNLLNAKEGLYARITHGFYGKILGGTQRYQLTRFDIRQYVQLFQNPNSVLAFQMLGHFSHGNAPLRELGRLGGDETLRGYFEGRYTDRHLLATQMEFRQKVTRRWGITAFVGAGSVAAVLHEFSLTTFRPAVGTGLRFLVDNVEELNLRIDFGVGTDLKYYFKIAEAF